ncbi:MAG: polyprenyl synthetase family protein [Kiritimatiellales bacterium]
MQKIKAEIEAQFVHHLEEHPFWTALAEESPAGFSAVRDTLLAPGKRLRPLLFCAACRDAGLDPLPGLMPVALALELAHSFILIHDDIIDRSVERRGEPTLPERINQLFAKKPADGFRGTDFALVTGDLLYTLAIESLLQADAPDAQKLEALQLFTRTALDTGHGALLEMRAGQAPPTELPVADIEKIYELKTGRYTFTLPLQLAAVFSNGWKKDNPVFPTIGKYAGLAFQLLNDLNDEVDDLRDGRRTWAAVHAVQRDGTVGAVRQAVEENTRRALGAAEGLPTVCSVLAQALQCRV